MKPSKCTQLLYVQIKVEIILCALPLKKKERNEEAWEAKPVVNLKF